MPRRGSSSKSSVNIKKQDTPDLIPLRRRKRSKVKGFFKGLGNILRCRSTCIATEDIEGPKKSESLPHLLTLDLPTGDLMSSPTPAPIARRISLEILTQEKRNKNAILPIGKLPPEVLTEVFAMICFSEVQASHTARRARTTPLTLIKVSHRWRAIVLSTPHLWSWVLIRLYKSRYQSQLGIIRDWLSRTSDSQPLTIELSFNDEDAWVEEPPHELLKMLLTHSNRWRSIDLTLPEECYQVIRTSMATFPNLENIALQPLLADAHKAQSDRKRLDVFATISNLSNLRLNGYYLDDCAIPWTQLQELVLQHIYVDECFYALDKASNLVSCTLSTMLLNDNNRTVVKHQLKLPKLEVFRMQGASGSDQGLLISHITAPSLSEFYLSSNNADKSFADIPEMVSRSGCLLRIFELNGLDVIESKLIDLLRALPTLETFRLNPDTAASLGNAFLEALCDNAPPPPSSSSSSASTKPFLPNLQCLEYDGAATFDEEVLVRMIRFRTEQNVQDRIGPGGSAAFLRRLEVFKLCASKSFSAECQALLAGLGGK